jgi:hypothetical protein
MIGYFEFPCKRKLDGLIPLWRVNCGSGSNSVCGARATPTSPLAVWRELAQRAATPRAA